MERYEDLSQVENTPTRPPIQKLQESDMAAIGYLAIRKYIGIIGVSLPILIFSISICSEVKLLPSLSDYYYTILSPLFTGGLLLISIFLFASKSSDFYEDIFNKVAAFSGIAIIIFPTFVIDKFKLIPDKSYTYADFLSFIHYSKGYNEYVGYLHLVSAFIFFSTLIILVFKKFIPYEKECNTNISKQKIQLYNICGSVMILCLFAIIFSNIILEGIFNVKVQEFVFPVTFTFESILLFFFGACWLTKSKSLDKRIKEIIYGPNL